MKHIRLSSKQEIHVGKPITAKQYWDGNIFSYSTL